MSVIDQLVTDRTQADLDRVRELKKKIMQGGGIHVLSDSERAEYFANPKGCYNFSDMNRVGNAILYIQNLYKTTVGDIEGLSAKTNWTVEDIPTQEQMETYLGNIQKIKAACKSKVELPLSMNKLNFDGANNIEKVLVDANAYAEALTRDFLYSGEFDAGEGLW